MQIAMCVFDANPIAGLDASPRSVDAYFSGAAPHPLHLAQYLSNLATPLARLSSPDELLAALAAFDDDDSGQVGMGLLLDAVCEGPGGLPRRDVAAAVDPFVGKRAFGGAGMGGGREEVFRYREWVAGLGAAGEEGRKEGRGEAVGAGA